MNLNHLKILFDAKSTELEVLNYKRDDAIIVALQLFEMKLSKIKNVNFVHPIWQREQIYDLQESLALILEWIYRYGDPNCKQTTSGNKNLSLVEEAFDLAKEYLALEASYKSVSQGFMIEQQEEVNEDTINIKFVSPDVAYFEAVNEIILTNYNYEKFNKMPSIEIGKMLSLGIFAATTVKSRMIKKLDVEFELPDDYVIGPYTIRQIKEVWGFVITKAYLQTMENAKCYKYTPKLMQLVEMDKFSYRYTSTEKMYGILNDLTYIGNYQKKNTKGKPIYSNFLTEPIVEVNGKKLISPSVILNYQVSRNILSTLNRIYGDTSHERKGELFINELIDLVKKYPNLLYAKEVPIKKPNKTDVDFALFDKETEQLLIFEIKWFNEPVTPVEINQKDQELEKATTKQLPNYYKGIELNPTEFIRKAFGVKLSAPTNLKLQGYVLTRCTVGSGSIDRNNFEVINHRMLTSAFKDYNGDLSAIKEALCDRTYYPKEHKDFDFGSVENRVGDFILLRDGYALL